MICEWRSKLDLYVDRELPDSELAEVETHLRGCPSCAADALGRMQLKRSIHAAAAQAFVPTNDFRKRIGKVAGARQRPALSWLPQIAFATAITVAVVLGIGIWARHGSRPEVLGEVADLHVATLASANPVDVTSTDRHTVKPWFEGKLPFTFNLPELQNSEFRLIGGRVAYVGQSPGAHLLFGVRKHQISVFVFQDKDNFAGLSASPRDSERLAFNLETWSDHGLRYVAIGDASLTDVRALCSLLRAVEE
jgi:anti-sigma factor RsiW